MSGFSDSSEPVFDEISIMVPSYSLEDLPTDLEEDAAEGLLNAFALAWHPDLVLLARGIPTVRQADSVHQLTGRHLLIVPPYAEDWMSHDWREGTSHFLHEVLSGCQTRQEWLDAVAELCALLQPNDATGDSLGPRSGGERLGQTSGGERLEEWSARRGDSSPLPIDAASAQPDAAPGASDARRQTSPDIQSLASFDHAAQVDAFLALGTTWLITVLTSRRMHHFVDPDENRLSREVHAAASARRRGDHSAVHQHLMLSFELLLEMRERFYPLPFYLIDLCIPSAETAPEELEAALADDQPLNLVATGADLIRWLEQSDTLGAAIRQRVEQKRLSVLSGQHVEVRTVLAPLTASLADLSACQVPMQTRFGIPIEHWARKRFGLISSWPLLLSHLQFQSAFHVALDDGLYPDRERSQFDWESASGACISATSRIPLAIDSAASILRMPDRLRESMQDDSPAVLYLARLPELRTPWLHDLRVASTFGAPLGEFLTVAQLADQSAGQRSPQKFDHADYLSPALIQAAVLKTESPVSGPARLGRLWLALEACHTLRAVLEMLGRRDPASGDAVRNSEILQEAESRILQFERDHADLQKPAATPELLTVQEATEEELSAALQAHAVALGIRLSDRLSQQHSGVRGILLVNPLPFARTHLLNWPADWQLPQTNPSIEAISEFTEPDAEATGLLPSRTCVVRLPPGGFVWVVESSVERPAMTVFQTARKELPLVQPMLLRNRHFEVTFSERHGGIESLVFHGTRANCVSQHVAWRFEREQQPPETAEGAAGTHYAQTRFLDSRTVTGNSLEAALETRFEILSPVDGRRLASGRQRVRIDRFRPRLQMTLYVDEIAADMKGNPWMEYLGCRFAWENELAAVTRSVWGQVAGFRGERIESPDYIEIADADRRLTVIPHGRPYHRRSGPRMLDSLMICEGEQSRRFDFTLIFDEPFPMRQALDAGVPPVRCETEDRVPGTSAHAWLWGVSARNVMVVRLRSLDGEDGHHSTGRLRLLLLETEGMIADCVVRTAVRPVAARLVLHNGQVLEELAVLDEGVLIRFNRFELREIELQFELQPA